MLNKIEIIESHGYYCTLGYNINNKLEYFLKEAIDEVVFLESIYLCKVININYGNNTAFVEIGDTGLVGFMNFSIQHQLQNGSVIPLQVRNMGYSTKEIRLDWRINFVGKYVVLSDSKFRRGCGGKVKLFLAEILCKYQGYGLIFRTNIPDDINPVLVDDEISFLIDEYNQVKQLTQFSSKPQLLSGGIPLYIKFIRDIMLPKGCRIFTNSSKIQQRLNNHLTCWQLDVGYQGELTVDFNSLETQKRRLEVKQQNYSLEIHDLSGINLIDVNGSGSNLPFFKVNYLALDEIIHQIKFRDLTGIILLDLIKNMSKDQELMVYDKLEKAFISDFRNVKILGFTKAGLFELIRMR